MKDMYKTFNHPSSSVSEDRVEINTCICTCQPYPFIAEFYNSLS